MEVAAWYLRKICIGVHHIHGCEVRNRSQYEDLLVLLHSFLMCLRSISIVAKAEVVIITGLITQHVDT